MQIHNINNTTSFGRIIELSNKNKNMNSAGKKRFSQITAELNKVLNNQDSQFYTKEQRIQIKTFFEEILGDYNGKNKILTRELQDKTVIISGQDAKRVLELEAISHKGKKEAKHREQTYSNAGSYIREKLENGKNGKPESSIELIYRKTSQKPKTDCVIYSSLAHSNVKRIDGFRTDIPVYAYACNALQTCSYEQKMLKIQN